MRLTILSVAYPFAPVSPETAGGAEQILLQLDRALTDGGHRSLVVARADSKIAGQLAPVPVQEGLLNDTGRRFAHGVHARTIRKILGEERIDLVHMHGIDFHAYLPSPRVPVLVTLHLPLVWYPHEALRPVRPDTWFQCVSASQHASCDAGMKLVSPIENGVPLPASSTTVKGDFALFLGRLCPEKGVHLAIDAALRAGIPLVIAGEVFPYEEHLRYFAEQVEPRLGERVRFIGAVGTAEKSQLLSQARCLLVPSLVEETSSLASREALAAGTPVIAFPRRALVDLIEHGRTGYIVDSVEAMAERILDARDVDPWVCRDAARHRFPLKRMLDAYLLLYRQLANARERVHAAAGVV